MTLAANALIATLDQPIPSLSCAAPRGRGACIGYLSDVPGVTVAVGVIMIPSQSRCEMLSP
jgi:hypothetical protein